MCKMDSAHRLGNLASLRPLSFDSIQVDTTWNIGDEQELKAHRIHSYPAKFPAFITTKALKYARDNNLKAQSIADVFCGCGTVALEARRNNIDFWGCDINPVATMIAAVKSHRFQEKRLRDYYKSIRAAYTAARVDKEDYRNANKRLKYWYNKREFNQLLKIKNAIANAVPDNSPYQDFFNCAFSNILKPTSKWLTKSIKPQVDPQKKPANVLRAFHSQVEYMISANAEQPTNFDSDVTIKTRSLLDDHSDLPKVDMIITSPPYVTSYEYADLHQLSSLWLEFTDDYRTLRNGSIGSLQSNYNFDREVKRLNTTGMDIVLSLRNRHKSKAKAVAKYYLDMQIVAERCFNLLNKDGTALFVIGDTEYKGVRIENAKHLAESLLIGGFDNLSISKRKISNKALTPYRDNTGKFTRDKSGKKIYSEEFIIVAHKKK